MEIKASTDSQQEVPKWAFKAVLWVGGAAFSILISVLGWIGSSFDSRLVRIEDILLRRPTSVTNINPDFSSQEQDPFLGNDNEGLWFTTTGGSSEGFNRPRN